MDLLCLLALFLSLGLAIGFLAGSRWREREEQ